MDQAAGALVDPEAAPDLPALPSVVMDVAYEIWAAYQAKFTGGHRPPRQRWDLLIMRQSQEPKIEHPFEDSAIEGAVAAYKIFSRYLAAPAAFDVGGS